MKVSKPKRIYASRIISDQASKYFHNITNLPQTRRDARRHRYSLASTPPALRLSNAAQQMSSVFDHLAGVIRAPTLPRAREFRGEPCPSLSCCLGTNRISGWESA